MWRFLNKKHLGFDRCRANICGTMFSGLDGVFLPLPHVGTAENQCINKSVKLAGIEKPMTDESSENIPVFIITQKVKKNDPPSNL